MRYVELKENFNFPLKKMKKLYHIGTLDYKDKDRTKTGLVTSYEGEGLSVTTDPFEWLRIAQLGGRPLWVCEKKYGIFLDNNKLKREHRDIMEDWAKSINMEVTPNTLTSISIAYSENILKIDGVWWSSRVSEYNAPRGVIVPGMISTWKFTKKYDSYG